MSKDYPQLYYYFRIWSEKEDILSNIFDKIGKKLVREFRTNVGKKEKTSLLLFKVSKIY